MLSWKLSLGVAIIAIMGTLNPAMSQNPANCRITLSGRVVDEKGGPSTYASIQLLENQQGALAGEDGRFTLRNLCPGQYTLLCTRVGAEELKLSFTLVKDTTLTLQLVETGVTLESVTVAASEIRGQGGQAAAELSGSDLEAGQGLGLGESLKRLPGVTTLNTGATIAKPVIQGLHSNRILIMNNGVRLEGQQWGTEHAPEVDPFIADQITVVKGAGSVRYGADALGGIILVDPRALPHRAGIGGVVFAQGLSNGRTGILSGILEGRLPGAKVPLSGRIQGTVKRGGNLQTPDYFLNNTGVKEYNFSWALGWQGDNWQTDTYYSRFYTELGILSDAHIGNLTDLNNAIARGRPLTDADFSYNLGRPQQRILHELVKVRSQLKTGDQSKLDLTYSRQFNRRQEYDAHKAFNQLGAEITDPSILFEITTHRLESDWKHAMGPNTHAHLGGNVMLQRNTTDRGALLPDYSADQAGFYWTAIHRKLPQPFEFEIGLRYDYQALHAGIQGADTLNANRYFSGGSGSLSMVYYFKENLRLRMNTGTAWRAPHVSELFSEGVHHGSASYETGNASLVAERAWNTSLTLEWNQEKRWNTTLTVYYNLIANYIFLEPAGTPRLTIRGAFPAFLYAQANARLMGLDWNAELKLHRQLTLESQVSLLRGWNRKLQDHLIFMPPDQFRNGLKMNLPATIHGEESFVRLTVQNVLRQSRTPASGDYAPAPAAFTRLDLEAVRTLHWGAQPIEVGLAVNNLTNTRYREYLNRFRYFTQEPGRNIILRVKVPFGIRAEAPKMENNSLTH
ncbi:MAG: TonB-dependent receptor [Lewinellaceae bacterium]|nr:TonB-dependent receptor [Lewinellaceae bacterium]